MNTEVAVKERYAAGAKARDAALCCPVSYNTEYLRIIPDEVIERDYGCGDPSQYVRPGETVLDLGSGTGKICFIASQVVGPQGRVIGVDMTDDMLEVARRNAPVVAARAGFANVEFRKGRIQDLALDLEALDEELGAHGIANGDTFLRAMDLAADLRVRRPLIASGSIDVVVSNCVLNLVDSGERRQLFNEIHRVLKPGGRAVISDIVSDEDVPPALADDPEWWSGCIGGASREDAFLRAFEEAGFYGIRLLRLDREPWRTVQGIEFRSMTVEVYKGSGGPCIDHFQAVIYKGPFKKVLDDDGHAIERGQRTAVCERTFRLFQREPYRQYFEFIEPRPPVAAADLRPFECKGTRLRHPRETKRQPRDGTAATDCCGTDGGNCC